MSEPREVEEACNLPSGASWMLTLETRHCPSKSKVSEESEAFSVKPSQIAAGEECELWCQALKAARWAAGGLAEPNQTLGDLRETLLMSRVTQHCGTTITGVNSILSRGSCTSEGQEACCRRGRPGPNWSPQKP